MIRFGFDAAMASTFLNNDPSMSKFDADGDGVLDEAELAALGGVLKNEAPPGPAAL